jgi:hypothetical protein
MARGGPDYGNPDYTFFTVETPISDVVAERQGFSRLDNRGRVLWFEDWRMGVTRLNKDYDNNASQVLHTLSLGEGIGYHGIVKLDPLANNGFAGLAIRFMLPVSKRIGLEFGFFLPGSNGQLFVSLEHNYTGTTRKAGNLEIKAAGAGIAIQDPNALQTIYTPTNPTYLQGGFTSVKYVVDVSINKFIRAMIGNQEYDISQYDLQSGSLGLVGDTYISFYCNGVSATNRQPVYVSYIVVSGDEP